jgi:hypothetical protein
MVALGVKFLAYDQQLVRTVLDAEAAPLAPLFEDDDFAVRRRRPGESERL